MYILTWFLNPYVYTQVIVQIQVLPHVRVITHEEC